ncbi:neprilysin-1-like [Ctenocephalides felis]|uniref:neprilysin-1-like n=1 Tax=Ctenocephalides felis TaxID=7515 RepID=UPI000E6E59AD|nr:neprilysin-1-like [Ctenocephalides felis]
MTDASEPMIGSNPRNGFIKAPNLAVNGGMAVGGTEPSIRRKKRPWWRRKNKTMLATLVVLLVAVTAGVWTIVFLQIGGGCSSGPQKPICLTEDCIKTASTLLSAMDHTADPCEDFFRYACGSWNKKHVIPEDRSSISTFEVLADQQQLILKGVLEEPIGEDDNQATIKAKTFYKSCVDIQQIRKIGDGPLRNVITSLGGWPVLDDNWQLPNFTLETLLGRLRSDYSEPILIELYVGADDKNSSAHIIQLDQLALALPSRDYYLKNSSEGDLQAYHRYMTQVAILMGANP